MNIQITPEFERIFKLFDAGQNVAILGSAGVGKSVAINLLRRRGQAAGKTVAVLAPTGIAARNVNGQTINSYFGLPSYLSSSHTLNDIEERIAKQLMNTDILIFDEESMKTALTFDNISDIAKYARCNGKPFGGMQVVIVGDPFQIPPVVNERNGDRKLLLDTCGYNSVFFFASRVYSELAFNHVELTHVFRQSDKAFIGVLNRLRKYQVTKEDLNYLNKRAQSEPPQNTLILGTTNKVVDRHNILSLDSNRNPSAFYNATSGGNFNESDCPASYQLFVKEGVRVMIVANFTDDNGVKAVNGDVGIIKSLYDDIIDVELDSGYSIAVTPFLWEKYGREINPDGKTWENTRTGFCTQFPIKVAAASTVHKAQGLSLPAVHIDLSSSFFCAGQAYTSLSRVRSYEGLTLSRKLGIYELMKFAPRGINGRANEAKILMDWYQQIDFNK